MQHSDNVITTILGRKRQGKTLLLRALIAKSRRAVVLDPQCRFSLPVQNASLPRVWAAVRANRAAEFRVRTQPHTIQEAETAAANAYAIGGLLLGIDELSIWWGARTDKGALWRCVMTGGNRGLDIAANVRRPAEFPRAFTSQTDVWCIFNTQEPIDLAFIRQATRPEVAEVCRSLPRLSFVQYACGESAQRIRTVKVDKAGRVDLD